MPAWTPQTPRGCFCAAPSSPVLLLPTPAPAVLQGCSLRRWGLPSPQGPSSVVLGGTGWETHLLGFSYTAYRQGWPSLALGIFMLLIVLVLGRGHSFWEVVLQKEDLCGLGPSPRLRAPVLGDLAAGPPQGGGDPECMCPTCWGLGSREERDGEARPGLPGPEAQTLAFLPITP